MSTATITTYAGAFIDGREHANSGAPLPVRFGTWFWGLGHTPGRAITVKGIIIEGLELHSCVVAQCVWRRRGRARACTSGKVWSADRVLGINGTENRVKVTRVLQIP